MMKNLRTNKKTWLASLLLVGILLAGWLLARWRKRRIAAPTRVKKENLDLGGPPPEIRGLTEEQVAARKPDFDLDAEIRLEERRFLRRAIRQSLFTTFNVDLFGITLVLFLLGSPMGALGSLFVLLLNTVLNVFQQMYTKRKLDLILKKLRPQATVVRDGRLHSVDPTQIVAGDVLVIGTGDEILVDGDLVGKGAITVEEISSNGNIHQSKKRRGDAIRAGDFCVEGRSVYRAKEAGFLRHRSAPGSELQLLLGERTPLQQFMEWVFRVLFGFVIAFGVLLVADSLLMGADLVSQEYRDAFSIVFGIAPTSLFFILILQYAMGTLRISEHGALVYKSRSIEALANANVLCISQESLVSGVKVGFEPIESPKGLETLSENFIRRALGDILHSVPLTNNMAHMLAEAVPGKSRPPLQIAPFLFAHGWFGVSFDEPDLRGTFIIGMPETLEWNLVLDAGKILENVEHRMTRVQRGLGRWFKRFRSQGDHQRRDTLEERVTTGEESESPGESIPAATEEGATWRQRFRTRLERLLSPMEDLASVEPETETSANDIVLLFAYLPEPHALYDQKGNPALPKRLVPLTRLRIAPAVRPEAGQTIKDLVDVGLQVKILAANAPEQAAATAQSLGLLDEKLSMASGGTLVGLKGEEFSRQVRETAVLGDLTPAQKAKVVGSLRAQGEKVVMVGSSVSDVLALRQADLRVALRSSSQAALRLTDIVLLEDSLEALPYVLKTGQRLVNGVLDTFKLYLSQVTAQLLLILAIFFLNIDQFPYTPTQAGVITAFTVAVPNILLSVWASAGRVTGSIIRRRLAHFILPAAVTGAILSLSIYSLFIRGTQDVDYAQLTVTYALLMAGWLRVLFVQPPTPLWMGGAPLRGDRRIFGLVIGAIAVFLAIMAFPKLQELLHFAWLTSIWEYFLISLAVVIWALVLRTVWRFLLAGPNKGLFDQPKG